MAAAVVELNSLPDAIGPAAEDDDLLAIRRRSFVFFFVGRIEIRRETFELGGASVHPFVHRSNPAGMPLFVYEVGCAATVLHFPKMRQPFIGESHALEIAQFFVANVIDAMRLGVRVGVRDIFQLMEEPRIDLRKVKYLFDRPAMQQRVANVLQALRMRGDQTFGDDALFDVLRGNALPCLQRADALHQGFLEGSSDGHRFAYRLHLRTEGSISTRKFLELPLGNFYDHIVECRLEARWRLARDVVRDLVERVADSETRGDLRDWESRSLRGECRRSRYAWVHLDHDHAPGIRVGGELDIRTAGLHADLADDLDRGITHDLVFAIAQRLCRCNGNRVASVDAHRIEVLDRADDDHVVVHVAHQFEFVLFPTEYGLFQQHFVNRREIESLGQQIHQLFAVIGDAPATTAERERRPQDQGESELCAELQPILQVIDERGARGFQTDLRHRIFEEQAIFRFLDGFQLRADEDDVVLVEYTAVGQFDSQVQSRLSTDGRQKRKLTCRSRRGTRSLLRVRSACHPEQRTRRAVRVRSRRTFHHRGFDTNDFFEILQREGLDVGAIGHLGV